MRSWRRSSRARGGVSNLQSIKAICEGVFPRARGSVLLFCGAPKKAGSRVFPRARGSVPRAGDGYAAAARRVFPRARGSVLNRIVHLTTRSGEGLPARAWECPHRSGLYLL